MISKQLAEPARGIRGRPGQAEHRTEIQVVSIHLVRLEEAVRVETGEGRVPQDVRDHAEILIAEAERQRQRWRGFPGVLEEVSLVELVRIEDRIAGCFADAPGGPAEIVEKV